MASNVDARKPLVAIFLDPHVFIDSQDSESAAKFSQAIRKMPSTKWSTQSKLIERERTGHYSPDAVARFMQLIERVQKSSEKMQQGAEVMIVLSSGWVSHKQSIESMKEKIFCKMPFVDSIRDRTSDYSAEDRFYRHIAVQATHTDSPYGGSKVWTWLKNNVAEKRFAIDHFVIIDSTGGSIASKNYPQHHVHVDPKQTFSAQNLEDAYRIATEVPCSLKRPPYCDCNSLLDPFSA